MVLKRLPEDLNSIFDFFEKSDFFLTSSDSSSTSCSDYHFSQLLYSRYPFLDLPTLFWIFLPLFGSSYPFFGSSYPFLDLPTPFWEKVENHENQFLGRGVLRDEFLLMWELSGWQHEHFLILSYGPKLHSWPFVLKKRRKSNFWGEEFFGMSSYPYENFQDGNQNIF